MFFGARKPRPTVVDLKIGGEKNVVRGCTVPVGLKSLRYQVSIFPKGSVSLFPRFTSLTYEDEVIAIFRTINVPPGLQCASSKVES